MEKEIINKAESIEFNNLRELRHDILYRADEANERDINNIRNLIRKLLERV